MTAIPPTWLLQLCETTMISVTWHNSQAGVPGTTEGDKATDPTPERKSKTATAAFIRQVVPPQKLQPSPVVAARLVKPLAEYGMYVYVLYMLHLRSTHPGSHVHNLSRLAFGVSVSLGQTASLADVDQDWHKIKRPETTCHRPTFRVASSNNATALSTVTYGLISYYTADLPSNNRL